jgi:hypothetical protein
MNYWFPAPGKNARLREGSVYLSSFKFHAIAPNAEFVALYQG